MRGPVGRSGQGTACAGGTTGHPATYTGAPSQFRRMASATLTRPRPGQPEAPAPPPALGAMALARPRRAHHRHDGRLLRLADVSPTTTATTRCSGAARCCTGTLPSFDAYRAPTEHPLAIAFGALLSLVGDDADRVMVGATLASFVVLAAGHVPPRRGRRFTPLVGPRRRGAAVHALRLPVPRGARRTSTSRTWRWSSGRPRSRPSAPRRGTPVFVLLAAAGLLRPEAWLLSGLYFLWCFLPATWPQRVQVRGAGRASARSSGPRWTGSSPATRCSRSPTRPAWPRSSGAPSGLSEIPAATLQFLRNLDKVPVFYAGILGLVVAIVLVAAARRDGRSRCS